MRRGTDSPIRHNYKAATRPITEHYPLRGFSNERPIPMIPLLICDDSSMARKQVLRTLPSEWRVSVTQACSFKHLTLPTKKEGVGFGGGGAF